MVAGTEVTGSSPKVAQITVVEEAQDSAYPDAPYCQRLVFQTDLAVNPVDLLIVLSGPVKYAGVIEQKVGSQGSTEVDKRDASRVRVLVRGMGDPLLSPSMPLVVRVCADREFHLKSFARNAMNVQ